MAKSERKHSRQAGEQPKAARAPRGEQGLQVGRRNVQVQARSTGADLVLGPQVPAF